MYMYASQHGTSVLFIIVDMHEEYGNFIIGCSSTSGNCIHPWALVDVAKLSFAYSLAQRA